MLHPRGARCSRRSTRSRRSASRRRRCTGCSSARCARCRERPSPVVTPGVLLEAAEARGVPPAPRRCVRCGDEDGPFTAFDLAEGGVLCATCGRLGGRRIEPEALEFLGQLVGGELHQAMANPPAPEHVHEVERLGVAGLRVPLGTPPPLGVLAQSWLGSRSGLRAESSSPFAQTPAAKGARRTRSVDTPPPLGPSLGCTAARATPNGGGARDLSALELIGRCGWGRVGCECWFVGL